MLNYLEKSSKNCSNGRSPSGWARQMLVPIIEESTKTTVLAEFLEDALKPGKYKRKIR